jgi:broad specificity phosphatase PhoE
MLVLATYVNIMASRLNPQGIQQAQQLISQLVQQGIVWWSQLIIIERNDS